MANRSELSNTFQRVEGMIQYVRENLDDEEYCVFLDMVAPLPEPQQSTKKAGRKSSKKSASKSSSKSSRASGMAAAINRSLSQQRQVTKLDDDNNDPCDFIYPDEKTCTEPKNSRLHDPSMGYAGYHEFQSAGKSSTPKAIPFCGKCGTRRDRPAHHDKASGDYHEFVQVDHAQLARGRSSTNGGATATTASSETHTEDVSNVHHVASGGD